MSIRPFKTTNKDIADEQTQKALDAYNFISSIYWGIKRLISNFCGLIHLSAVTDMLKILLPGVSYLLTFLDIAFSFIEDTVVSTRSTHTRAFKTILNIAVAAITIASFVVAGAWIYPVMIAASLIGKIWDCGTIIASKLFGKDKNLTPGSNEAIKSDARLAEALHKVAISSLYLIASILLMNPVTVVIGTIAIIALTTYMLSEVFKVNPLRKLGNWLFNHPFATNDEAEDITVEKVVEVSLTAQQTASSTASSRRVLDITMESEKDPNKVIDSILGLNVTTCKSSMYAPAITPMTANPETINNHTISASVGS